LSNIILPRPSYLGDSARYKELVCYEEVEKADQAKFFLPVRMML